MNLKELSNHNDIVCSSNLLSGGLASNLASNLASGNFHISSDNHDFGLYLSLMHSDVVNKKGDLITSSVTNLDLHDMARVAKTYGIRKFYVVTPLEDQQTLVKQITSHWITGVGGELNPARKEALKLISIKDSMASVKEDIFTQEKVDVKIVATTAKKRSKNVSFKKFRQILNKRSCPLLMTFGTAWGLSEEFMLGVDYVLEPILGCTDYNHLSVRSATSIILYRLLDRSL